jgi:protein ImuB
LLEVGRSLKFFSGLKSIKQLLVREFRRRGLEFNLSAASTPLAALWLARAKSVDVPSHAELPGFLRVLDLAVTGWPAPVQRRLREMGITTIGEILRLPRAGFARRFGRECLEDLDRASGRLPDPQRVYQAPQKLCWAADFETELIDRQILATAIESGVESLVCDLRERQAEVSEIGIDLLHLHGPDTRECVQFVEPVHGQARLLAPLLVHLETVALTRPITGLRLQTGVLLPMECAAARLLVDIEDGPAAGVSPFALIECLRGRLGLDAVCGIELLAEHRPERAWNRLTHGLMQVESNPVLPSHRAAERPLWLLPWPRSLNRPACIPETISGPERIESGWWDGMDVRRDYYVTRTEDGERWWVFRDCETEQWYLHGFFA